MSHFTVLVIGDGVDEQLQPYHEYECTGVEDEYVVWVDEHDEVLKDWPEHQDEYDTIEDFAESWYGYKKNDEGRFGRFTNPNAKWDWWVIGGRWNGFFEVKEGREGSARLGEKAWCSNGAEAGTADQLRIGDIDWDKMRDKARERANKEYDEFEAAVGDIEPPAPWKVMLEEHGMDKIDVARAERQSHPWIKALREAKIWIFDDEVEHYEVYNGGRETFVEKRINQVGVPYAFVKDSKWVGKGDMGWWGMSDDHHDQNDWNEKFHEMLSGLDPDTMVTLVDCHI